MMIVDALHRNESCGCHLREESQTDDGEAVRNDEQVRVRRGVGVQGADQPAELHQSRSPSRRSR